MFNITAGNEPYTRSIKVSSVIEGYSSQGPKPICTIQNSVGHCCGMSMLGNLTPYGFWQREESVDAFMQHFKDKWAVEYDSIFRDDSNNGLTLFDICGFHIALSRETAQYDQALRNYPGMTLVQVFRNNRGGPASKGEGHEISLYYLEF